MIHRAGNDFQFFIQTAFFGTVLQSKMVIIRSFFQALYCLPHFRLPSNEVQSRALLARLSSDIRRMYPINLQTLSPQPILCCKYLPEDALLWFLHLSMFHLPLRSWSSFLIHKSTFFMLGNIAYSCNDEEWGG